MIYTRYTVREQLYCKRSFKRMQYNREASQWDCIQNILSRTDSNRNK